MGVYKLRTSNKRLGFLKKQSIHKIIGKFYDELDEGWLSRMRYEYVTLTRYQLDKLQYKLYEDFDQSFF